MNKIEKFNSLLKEMSICNKCINLKKNGGMDCSLINIYTDVEFSKNIPSIWTDCFNRLNSKIMIIGQDWGPFQDIKKLHDSYVKNQTEDNWNFLINQEKSMTKRMLTKYLIESSKKNNEKILNKIFITNAIMCARQGNNYRENNIKLKECTMNCRDYLKMQIDIVEPKIILTLGYYPLYSLAQIYNLKIEKNLTQTIKKYDSFKIEDMTIIPLYHPTAQVKKEEQIRQYSKIWNTVKIDEI